MSSHYLTGMAIDEGGKPFTIATFDQDMQRWVFECLPLGTHVVLPYIPQTKERLGDELKSYHEACMNVMWKRRGVRRAERAVLEWKSRYGHERG